MDGVCSTCGRGEKYVPYKIFIGTLKEREHLGDIGVDGRIIWSLRKCDGRVWNGTMWLRVGYSDRVL
jgi:hypothetical protein